MPDASAQGLPDAPRRGDVAWSGETYHGREQVKAAPFNNWLVGTYIFLAGLSGGAMILATLLDMVRPERAARTVARGNYIAMLAPTLGAAMLVRDLHTPSRFYNMLRVFKTSSPMSVGSWLLVGFGMFGGITAVTHWLAGHLPGCQWMRGIARAARLPAAASGAGLATYTASLLSATSTPLWAAAPAATGVRFGASSMASAAAALSLAEPVRGRTRRDLDLIAVAALAAELAAIGAAEVRYRETGVDGALNNLSGLCDRALGTGLGVVLPLGLHAMSLAFGTRSPGRRSGMLSRAASLAILLGGAAMRISFLAAGDDSALDPSISMRFAQPRNLPPDC